MNSAGGYDLIREIDTSKETWRLRVRIVRKWSVRKKENLSETRCVCMVLMDEDKSKIQAAIPSPNLIQQYETKLIEGESYEMENFRVDDHTGPYKTTTHPYRLTFNKHTYFQRITHDIPTHCFSFAPISDILSKEPRTDILYDVIGFLKSFGSLEPSQVNSEAETLDRLSFAIADADDNTVDCVLYGESAANAYYSEQEHYMEPPIVVVLQLARLRMTRFGELQITNSWSTTKVYFNPNIPEVKELIRSTVTSSPVKMKMAHRFTQLTETQSSQRDLLHSTNRIAISDIPQNNEAFAGTVVAEIQKLETSFGWWYYGCTKCASKPKSKDGQEYCYGCRKTMDGTEPKFKVHYQVSDSTGQTSVVFFDQHVSELLQISARQLWDRLRKSGRPHSFPEELNQLVGQKMVLRLVRSKRNNPTGFLSLTVAEYQKYQHLPQHASRSNSKISGAIEDKGKRTRKRATEEVDDISLSDIKTPKLSTSTFNPTKFTIKGVKLD